MSDKSPASTCAADPLAAEFERCRGWIEGALAHAGGTHTADDILEGIRLGRYQFWPGEAAACVTEFVTYPRLLALNLFLVGGDMAELLARLPDVEAWAKERGCSRVQCAGRFGWERVLKNYEKFCIALKKEI